MTQQTVREVMTDKVVTVREDASYREIVEHLVANHISAVPVVDYLGHAVGVVSEADVLHRLRARGATTRRRFVLRHRDARRKETAVTAEQLMTRPAMTITSDGSVVSAARRMARWRVRRLPVTDELGRVVGIVSRGDLLHALVRPDADIHTEIEKSLIRALGSAARGVTVDVLLGIVTLTGELDHEDQIRAVGGLTRTVEGVAGVSNRLTSRRPGRTAENREPPCVTPSEGLHARGIRT